MGTFESAHALLANYYQQHCDELRAYVYSRIKRTDIAEDIVQNVFVKLLKTEVITPVTLPSLVYTVVRNKITDYWRHRRFVEEYEHIIGRAWRYGGDVVSEESVYSVQEVYALLENGIAHLTSKQQQVYRLHIYEGMKVSEISETLHINYKAVENRLGAARKQVRYFMQRMLA